MRNRCRTLVTGFGPFGEIADNPSALLAARCGRPFELLQVSYREIDRFFDRLQSVCFDRLILMGVAAGRTAISLEMRARNRIGPIEDVHGEGPDRGVISPGLPPILPATAWSPSQLPLFGSPSRDAGDYLCNYSLFRGLQRLPTKRVGFIHVPLPDTLPLDVQADRIDQILRMIES